MQRHESQIRRRQQGGRSRVVFLRVRRNCKEFGILASLLLLPSLLAALVLIVFVHFSFLSDYLAFSSTLLRGLVFGFVCFSFHCIFVVVFCLLHFFMCFVHYWLLFLFSDFLILLVLHNLLFLLFILF